MLAYMSLMDSADDKSKFERVYQSYKGLMFYTANRILNNPRMLRMPYILPLLRSRKIFQKFRKQCVQKRRSSSLLLLRIPQSISIGRKNG